MGGQRQRWRRLNAAAAVDEGVCAARVPRYVERAGQLGAQRDSSEGGRGSTGGGGSWHERQGAGALAVARCALEKVGCAVGGSSAASVSQAAARSWMASEQHRAHYRGMQSRGAAQQLAGSGRAVLRCGGRRRERCKLWVRGTTRERKQFGPLLLPTHGSACIPHGTVEAAQKPPIVREAFLFARSS